MIHHEVICMTQNKTKLTDKLEKIRKPRPISAGRAAAGTVISAFTGVMLGVSAKWLDDLALDSDIWWHRIVERLNLSAFFSDIAIWLLIALVIAVISASAKRAALNVFVFFAGMCAAYHIWTIVFSGFDPGTYMLIWYGITLVSPLPGALCWYARGNGYAAAVISCLIMAVFWAVCFNIGLVYIGLKDVLSLLVFIAAAAILHKSRKRTAVMLAAGAVLALPVSVVNPFK